MSASEVTKLYEQNTEIIKKLSGIEQQLSNYEKLSDMVITHDKRLDLFEQKCLAVQSAKTKINWSVVLTSITSSAIAVMVTYLITRFMLSK